jgi:hypothetical protein
LFHEQIVIPGFGSFQVLMIADWVNERIGVLALFEEFDLVRQSKVPSVFGKKYVAG